MLWGWRLSVLMQRNHCCLCLAGRRLRLPQALTQQQSLKPHVCLVLDNSGASCWPIPHQTCQKWASSRENPRLAWPTTKGGMTLHADPLWSAPACCWPSPEPFPVQKLSFRIHPDSLQVQLPTQLTPLLNPASQCMLSSFDKKLSQHGVGSKITCSQIGPDVYLSLSSSLYLGGLCRSSQYFFSPT